MWDIETYLIEFFARVAQREVEIYNEFSLQHELGCYLRSVINPDVRIQFERPVSFFSIEDNLTKKEIDISLFLPDKSFKVAIELKFPRNGQHPEQMFKACQDIAFLEQLCARGFNNGYFVMVAEDPLFYASGGTEGIYRHFRIGAPICGSIEKPTGRTNELVEIHGSHIIQWLDIVEKSKYVLVRVDQPFLTSGRLQTAI